MHLLGVLCLFLLVMAELACPACGKISKGQCGLSIHMTRWCEKKNSNFTDLLQQRQECVDAMIEDEQRQLHLKAEKQAEREQIEWEQDALRAQRLADFESLAVSSESIIIHHTTNSDSINNYISVMGQILVRTLNAGHQASPPIPIAFHGAIVTIPQHY